MKFKPEDFGNYRELSTIGAAQLANSKMQEWLDAAPVVYRAGSNEGLSWWNKKFGEDTHRARLLCIEPLEHECVPAYMLERSTGLSAGLISPTFFKTAKCTICGSELVARWEKKK